MRERPDVWLCQSQDLDRSVKRRSRGIGRIGWSEIKEGELAFAEEESSRVFRV